MSGEYAMPGTCTGDRDGDDWEEDGGDWEEGRGGMGGDEMMIIEMNDDGFRMMMKNAMALTASTVNVLSALSMY